jgi:hypothetical protein
MYKKSPSWVGESTVEKIPRLEPSLLSLEDPGKQEKTAFAVFRAFARRGL